MELDLTELSQRFSDEEKARGLLEAIRWPDGTVCPQCDGTRVCRLEPKPDSPGLWECEVCRKQFAVTDNSIFEGSQIKLQQWVMAIHVMCASVEGINALQLQRILDPLSYGSAWEMCRKMRNAMRRSPNRPLSLHPWEPEEVLADLFRTKP